MLTGTRTKDQEKLTTFFSGSEECSNVVGISGRGVTTPPATVGTSFSRNPTVIISV